MNKKAGRWCPAFFILYKMNNRFLSIYKLLFSALGPQHWWPGRTPFEVMVGAILTQNTAWTNVSKAIQNLKHAHALSPVAINNMNARRLAGLIRPSGYYNQKARHLKIFTRWYLSTCGGNVRLLRKEKTSVLRSELLSLKGIGPETADSILLYALEKPVFVIDAYTRRICSRHGLCSDTCRYLDLQALFMDNLRPGAKFFNEYHGLIVHVGKEFCRKNSPRCDVCPLLSDLRNTAIKVQKKAKIEQFHA